MEPNDEQLMGLMPQQLRDDLATVARMAAHGAGPDVTPELFEGSLATGALQFARAVLARYGHRPAPPAEGEVVKAVRPSRRQLIMLADDMGMASVSEAAEYARAVLARYGHQPAPHAEGEGLPSDQEIADVFSQGCRDLSCSHEPPFLGGARAILARWGRPALVPAPPAEGEVAELVAWMEDEADQYDCIRQAAETSHKLRRAAYLLAHHHPAPPTEGEVGELIERLNLISDGMDALGHEFDSWFVARAADLLERCHPEPVPVSERLPEPSTKVLAHYFNALGKGRTICAIWVPAKSRSDDLDSADDDFMEYNEEDDRFYWPEGWYEAIENWDDLGWVKVYEGEVIYWQPLPKWPAPPLPAGEVQP